MGRIKNAPVEQELTGSALVNAGQPVTADEMVAARTAGDAAPSDRFVKVFTIFVGQLAEQDWDDPAQESMHRANQVATLQDAIHRGLHPKEPAQFDGAKEVTGGNVALTYSVKVVPATLDTDAAGTYTPSAALNDMGGSTA
jgi:hypothetical protein